VVERRQDAGCESGGTSAFDQLDHRVQVNRTIGGDRRGEFRLDARAQKAVLTPRGEVAAGLGRWRSEAGSGE
jgi:hypothetical protein